MKEFLKEFLLVGDIAEILQISENTARNLFKDKKIPGKKIAGKYVTTKDLLKKFIESDQNDK